jgi:hypothetical protein
MKTDGKPRPVEAPGRDSVISQFSDWVKQETENFFAAQPILLDLVALGYDFASIRLSKGLSASICRTGSAHQGKGAD